MTDNEIMEALGELELYNGFQPKTKILIHNAMYLINRQKAEIERLEKELELANADKVIAETHEKSAKEMFVDVTQQIKTAKSELIKELSKKITEIFVRYEHLHSYAEGARKDYIETADGKEIEMQSVWDVITLRMNGMAEYEEMVRLQNNIELIAKDRILSELEKDFRLLVKEIKEVSE